MADTTKPQQDSTQAKLDAIALAEQAEAEAAEAEALATAARARARAIQLRREAQTQAADESDAASEPAETEAAEATGTADGSAPPDAEEPAAKRRFRVRVSVLLAAATVVAIVVLLGASGWMAWNHHKAVQAQQRSAAYIATARQGVINLTSLDFNKSKEDIQRILDSATGEFKDQFQKTADDFASVVKDTKAVAEGSVAVAAVESMTDDSAVVLVLANERVTNVAGAKDQPRTFRFRVSVVHDGDQLKMSKVEFVL